MTVVTMLSLAGSPGVTTLACLVASTWDSRQAVAVVECDPSGGDLAARFELTSTIGWPSLTSAVRRSGTGVELDSHLQWLPGGLPVVVGAGHGDPVSHDAPEAQVVRAGLGTDGVAFIDLGRVIGATDPIDGWLAAGDYAVLVAGGDEAAAIRVWARASELLGRTAGRLGLVVVGGTAFSCRELAEFCGLEALGDVPRDADAAAVASGAASGARRLERSRLLAAARHVGASIAVRVEGTPSRMPSGATVPCGPSPGGSILGILRPTRRRSLSEGAA